MIAKHIEIILLNLKTWKVGVMGILLNAELFYKGVAWATQLTALSSFYNDRCADLELFYVLILISNMWYQVKYSDGIVLDLVKVIVRM